MIWNIDKNETNPLINRRYLIPILIESALKLRTADPKLLDQKLEEWFSGTPMDQLLPNVSPHVPSVPFPGALDRLSPDQLILVLWLAELLRQNNAISQINEKR